MTTQQSGFMGPGGAESSQVLVKSLVKVAFRGELLFRPLRPDSIETDPGIRNLKLSVAIVPAS